MENGCYNCDYKGGFENHWFWLVTDSKDDSVGHSTFSMTDEEARLGDIHTEVHYCPKCYTEQ